MIKIAIVDDQPEDLQRIRQITAAFFQSRQEHCLIREFESALDLLWELDCGTFYSLYLIDIELPRIDGLSLGREILHLDASAQLMFITNHMRYAVEAYELHAFRYLMKRNLEQGLMAALNGIFTQLLQRDDRFYVIHRGSGLEVIAMRDIYAIEKDERNIIITHREGKSRERCTLHQAKTRLDPDLFMEIGRGIVIGLIHIKRVQHREVTLRNGEVYPVSKKRLGILKERIKSLWEITDPGDLA